MARNGPLISASGSYLEIGRQVGEATRGMIAETVDHLQSSFEELSGVTFARAEEIAMAHFLPFAERHTPECVDEMKGISEGAGIPFSWVVLCNCGEDFLLHTDDDRARHGGAVSRAQRDHCTSFAVSHEGRHVSAHNEDWEPHSAHVMVALRMTVPDGTQILTMVTPPALAFDGMNSHGMAFGQNTVHALDSKFGVPNVLVNRRALEASTVEEARRRLTLSARARGSSCLLLHREGAIVAVETTGTDSASLQAQGDFMVHACHYVDASLAASGVCASDASRHHALRVHELLELGLGTGIDPVELAASILRDHDGYPGSSICVHVDNRMPLDQREATVASMIWDLDAMRMHWLAGQPCQSDYEVVEME
jgi:predicted choloylglycine hydrolase